MEARLPVEGSFGNNKFTLIYNRCGVMAARSRRTLKKSFIEAVSKNDPLR